MKVKILVAALFTALLLTPSAFAAGNTSLQKPPTYNGPAGNVQGQVQQGVAGAVAQTGQAGTLPFTGQDLALLVAAGIVLLGVGAGFRRLSRPNDRSDA